MLVSPNYRGGNFVFLGPPVQCFESYCISSRIQRRNHDTVTSGSSQPAKRQGFFLNVLTPRPPCPLGTSVISSRMAMFDSAKESPLIDGFGRDSCAPLVTNKSPRHAAARGARPPGPDYVS